MNTSRPARIGFCITELEPGGTERCLVELVRGTDRTRFEPVVYCLGPRPVGNASNRVTLADELEGHRAPLHFLNGRSSVQFPQTLTKLRRLLVSDKPLLLQSFLFHANVLGTIAGRMAGVPHILTGIRVAEREKRWHLALARWTSRWVERHVCVSRSVHNFSIQTGGLPESKLIVIPNSVDCQRFRSDGSAQTKISGLTTPRRLMICVGRLEEQKGVTWLVELLPKLLPRVPMHDLVFAGDGPLRDALERRIRELGLNQRVHFLGYRHDIPQILSASDLLVLPSRWEGMPNVVLEAMASGKPVVAMRVEGVAELLGDGVDAQAVAPHDASGFLQRIVDILNNRELAEQLATANRQRAQTTFSRAAMIDAYQRLYTQLLAANR